MEVGDMPNILHNFCSEPWPVDIKLFQPFAAKQILIQDDASCLSVKAYLHMCDVQFEVFERVNAEEMSPSGRVPFIKSGATLVSEQEPIFSFFKRISPSRHLDVLSINDMNVYISLVNATLMSAELYMTWVDQDTYNTYTKVRTGFKRPWPLSSILTERKRNRVHNRLRTLGWMDKSIEEVFQEVKRCCNALSTRLDNQKYFFGNIPTELDALVFGHIYTILRTTVPCSEFANIIEASPNLVAHSFRIQEEYFNGKDSELQVV